MGGPRLNRPELLPRTCNVCRRQFQPKRAQQFICSRECFKRKHSKVAEESIKRFFFRKSRGL